MATIGQWISGARVWTLPAAVAPVAAGTGAAAELHAGDSVRALLALLVALALQVGVNYANDYSDGIRGTDRNRVGPFRLTGSGAARPFSVRAAAFIAFGIAALAGTLLAAVCRQWWLLIAGAGCIAAAWYYTAGRHPYGYRGLGEVFVFLFFGLVAVLGTTYTQAGRVSTVSICAAIGIGSLASALLVANNLRDLPTDAAAGKRTLIVRLGDAGGRALFSALLLASWLVLVPVVVLHRPASVTFLALPLSLSLLLRVGGAQGSALLRMLRLTGQLELVYGLLLGLSLAWHP